MKTIPSTAKKHGFLFFVTSWNTLFFTDLVLVFAHFIPNSTSFIYLDSILFQIRLKSERKGLLATAALWVRIQTFLKNTKMGVINKGVANTVARQKKGLKKIPARSLSMMAVV
jgi:hypothetical protein